MKKFSIVAWEEIAYHMRQWSFYVSIILMPLVFGAIGAIPRLQTATEQVSLPSMETILDIPSDEIQEAVGYVDHAGVIRHIPLDKADNFLSYATESAAADALNEGKITSFYVIAADYIASGQVVQFSQDPQLLASTDGAVNSLLRDNILARLNNPQLEARLREAVKLERLGKPEPAKLRFIPADLEWSRLISAGAIIFLFIYAINVSGNLLLRSLQREVKARVLEVMIVSTTPEQFIGGKLLGLSFLTMIQAGVTLLAMLLVYGRNPDGSGPAALPVFTLLLSLPYLVLGFLAYCGGIMSIAALWPYFRESGSLLSIMRLLTLFPLIGVLFILPDPDGPVSVALTIIPLTSHLLMPFRLLLSSVPIAQWLLGLILLILWAALWVWLSMRLFRAHGMLTGRSAEPRVLWQALWQ